MTEPIYSVVPLTIAQKLVTEFGSEFLSVTRRASRLSNGSMIMLLDGPDDVFEEFYAANRFGNRFDTPTYRALRPFTRELFSVVLCSRYNNKLGTLRFSIGPAIGQPYDSIEDDLSSIPVVIGFRRKLKAADSEKISNLIIDSLNHGDDRFGKLRMVDSPVLTTEKYICFSLDFSQAEMASTVPLVTDLVDYAMEHEKLRMSDILFGCRIEGGTPTH
ncbi:hypothetical protein Pla110_09440 [Polystyrenella longa]|uniref:Uncharacterized protein n=1 Tax=Polystyrenella longa TaxID=2528007 RepID=A0A518CJ37_9PLAN|nr:hypothetical protein [Polystyrenella longa]QDU79238.1 hypothetical protein Pla110_09440 [Polystyrenella longa]